MIINTKYFDEIEIDENKVIVFTDGLLGFEELRKFIVLDVPDNDAFQCLQSIEEREVAFLLIKPWNFFPDYEFDISKEELLELMIQNKDQIAIYNIVTIPKDTQKITANLLAPVVINIESLTGKQLVLHDSSYRTKHLLFNEENGGK